MNQAGKKKQAKSVMVVYLSLGHDRIGEADDINVVSKKLIGH